MPRKVVIDEATGNTTLVQDAVGENPQYREPAKPVLDQAEALNRMKALRGARSGEDTRAPEPPTRSEVGRRDTRGDPPPVERPPTQSAEDREPDTLDEDLISIAPGGSADAPEGPPDDDDPVVFSFDGAPVNRSEAQKGYLRQRDYSAKTAELAEQRRRWEAGIAENAQAREALGQRLQATIAGLAEVKPPDPALKATDPLGYQEQLGAFLLAQQERGQRIEEYQRLRAEHQQEQARLWETRRQEAQELMIQSVPSLRQVRNDPEKLKKVMGRLKETGRQCGYSDQEMAQILDPRIGQVLELATIGLAARRKAAGGRGGNGADRALDPPRNPSNGQFSGSPAITLKGGSRSSGNGQQPTSADREVDATQARLSRTGKLRDAQDAMRALRARREAQTRR